MANFFDQFPDLEKRLPSGGMPQAPITNLPARNLAGFLENFQEYRPPTQAFLSPEELQAQIASGVGKGVWITPSEALAAEFLNAVPTIGDQIGAALGLMPSSTRLLNEYSNRR